MITKPMLKNSTARSLDYETVLIEQLKDPEEARAYLNAALQEEDPRVFLLALKRIVLAQKSMVVVRRKAKLSVENFEKIFNARTMPRLETLVPLLHAVGFDINFELISKK